MRTRDIFILYVIIFLFQIPSGLLLKKYSLSASIIFNQLFVMALFPLAYIKFLKRESVESMILQNKNSILIVLFTAIAALSLAIISDYLMAATSYVIKIPITIYNSLDTLLYVPNNLVYLKKTVLLAIFPAFFEEFFFRGICQTTLSARYGKWTGIVIASGFFAAAHANPYFLHLYFMLGLFFGWIYESGKSIWLPILCHFINNFWTVSSKYFGVSFPISKTTLLNVFIFLGLLATLILSIRKIRFKTI